MPEARRPRMSEPLRWPAGVLNSVILAADDASTFAHARRLGFAGVDVDLRPGDLDSRERLHRLRAAQAATGLAIPSLVLGEHSARGGLGDADPTIAALAGRDVLLALDWAAELAADVILVPFFARGDLADDEAIDRAAAAFRPLCERAAERGVTLCYEGTLPADGVRRLADGIESPAFGCYFDLANATRIGLDGATEIRALGSLVRRVHVKDAGAQPGRIRPGRGLVDFEECAEALREIGYDDWLVLETPPSLPELVGRDLSFVRSVFPELDGGSAWPRFGMFTYDFGRGESAALVETCRLYGLEAVQLGRDLLDECLESPDLIEPFVSLLTENGIEIAALAGYRNLVAPDPAVRRENIDYIARCLEHATRFGTSVVATETGTRNPASDWLHSPENRSAATWALLCEALEELVSVAERHCALLALEATVSNVLATESQIEELFERFPSPNLQLVLDPYNYVSRHLLPAQKRITAAFLDRCEHRFVLAHLKDVRLEGAGVTTPEFGTGSFEQRPYLEFLRERRPDLPLILEHLPLHHVPTAVGRARYLSS